MKLSKMFAIYCTVNETDFSTEESICFMQGFWVGLSDQMYVNAYDLWEMELGRIMEATNGPNYSILGPDLWGKLQEIA